MARLWSRKRNRAHERTPADREPVESVRLDDDLHAWWAQEEVKQVWRPKGHGTSDGKPQRDILAEHFGRDWRTNFGFTPADGDPAEDDSPGTGSLADVFGEDWRTNVYVVSTNGDDASEAADAAEAAVEEPPEPEPEEMDPYEVLEVDPSASWDEIIAAHRRQARINHPDLLFGQSAEEKAASEERIRIINAAYKELRVRRGI